MHPTTMTTTRQSTCCGHTGANQAGCACSAGILERPRYFPRQLITPDELTLEADYFRDRMRRHNVYLHGWGVVCGALVCVVPAKPHPTTGSTASRPSAGGTAGTAGNVTAPATEPWLVRVEPGYILGPYGDEIVIECPREVGLRGSAVSGCPGGAGDDLGDPWCTEVHIDKRTTDPIYVAVRYQQCQVRPVLAQPAGCDCGDLPCEYSRFRDSYEIGILDHCPDSPQHDDAGKGAAKHHERTTANPVCPPCPESPWVVLAEVTVDANGTIKKIDNCSRRRIVASARDDWFHCGGTAHDYPPPNGTQATGGATEKAPRQEGGAAGDDDDAEPTEKPARRTTSRSRARRAGSDNT